MAADELTLAVVGTDYLNADGSNRRFDLALCRPGDAVELRPEPRNRFDPSAIGVWRAGGGQIGYLPAYRCGWVGTRMAREEVQAIFQGTRHGHAFIRVRFGGGEPTLPPEPPAEIEPDDTFRDEDGPLFGA